MPDASRQSSATKAQPGRSSPAPRDNRQIEDDTVPSGEIAGGISNRPLEEERDDQERVPPRGEGKEDSNA